DQGLAQRRDDGRVRLGPEKTDQFEIVELEIAPPEVAHLRHFAEQRHDRREREQREPGKTPDRQAWSANRLADAFGHIYAALEIMAAKVEVFKARQVGLA